MLSDQAWAKAHETFKAIQNHPFNQELTDGSLSKDIFAYYLEQDIYYLTQFSRALLVLAARMPIEKDRLTLLDQAQNALSLEQKLIHEPLKKNLSLKKTGHLTPATLGYTSFLLQVCALESIEIAVASLLPCFWVYYALGLEMQKETCSKNPYWPWIETYASPPFQAPLKAMRDLFETLGKRASRSRQSAMMHAFHQSVCMEWHFWNDVYDQKRVDFVCL